MKQLMMVLMIAMVATTSYGWKETSPTQKEYVFKFDLQHKLSSTPLEIPVVAGSYEDAFDSAAQKCFRYYKGSARVSEDRGLDIIDICANPRT